METRSAGLIAQIVQHVPLLLVLGGGDFVLVVLVSINEDKFNSIILYYVYRPNHCSINGSINVAVCLSIMDTFEESDCYTNFETNHVTLCASYLRTFFHS